MTAEDDTTDPRFLDWKETTASALLDRLGHLSIAQFREWLTDIQATGRLADAAPESWAVVAFLGAELSCYLHQELSSDYPELAETLRDLSFDESLHAVYSATHGRR